MNKMKRIIRLIAILLMLTAVRPMLTACMGLTRMEPPPALRRLWRILNCWMLKCGFLDIPPRNMLDIELTINNEVITDEAIIQLRYAVAEYIRSEQFVAFFIDHIESIDGVLNFDCLDAVVHLFFSDGEHIRFFFVRFSEDVQ